MTLLPQRTLQELFRGQVKVSGESSARLIFAKNYPYATEWITPEALFVATPIKKIKPRLIYVPPVESPVVIPITEPAPVTISAPSPAPRTKLEQAKLLYQTTSDKSRPALIALFVKELGMTPGGASTYASSVKKC